MTTATIQEWIAHPEKLNAETLYELRTSLARYPYFQTLRLLYLKNLYLMHDQSFGNELKKMAVYIADRKVLFYLIEGDKYTLIPQQPRKRHEPEEQEEVKAEEPARDRTLTLIDAFLTTAPDEETTSVGLNYASDYSAYLFQQEEEKNHEEEDKHESASGFDLINGFIEQSKEEKPIRLQPLHSENQEIRTTVGEDEPVGPPPLSDDEDEGCLTQTLAIIYIRQKKYSKALEIIKKLSLKYPKKNAYFADQIRFLEKLIINANIK